VLAGGGLTAAAISIGNGGDLLIWQPFADPILAETITDNGAIAVTDFSYAAFTGSITGSGSVTIEDFSAATFSGSVTGAEAFTIDEFSSAIFTTAIAGTGSFVLENASYLEFAAADSDNVSMSGAFDTLKIDHSLTAPFTGTLSGLGVTDAVDLGDLSWTKPIDMKATFAGNASGGTLTVSNGKNSVALQLQGNYTDAAWILLNDGDGGTLVTESPFTGALTPNAGGGASGAIDLSCIGFGANTTLGYSANAANTGGTLTVTDGTQSANIALLGQYTAASFAMTSDGNGGTLITEPAVVTPNHLAQPYA
jgi:hypothetical protein